MAKTLKAPAIRWIAANPRSLSNDLDIHTSRRSPAGNQKLDDLKTSSAQSERLPHSLSAPLTGTYNAKSRAFVITWTSQIVGGPFNGFTGSWHLAGKFAPAK